jgi:peptidoglycan/LPS O-acetylase OafA/YrhL
LKIAESSQVERGDDQLGQLPQRQPRIPALDGLRGIAILLVLFLHLGQFGHGLPAPIVFVDKLFIRLARTGWMGVDLFFVLSGFLITGILADTKGNAHYFRQFYARRVLRIFPLYYASLALFLIVLPALMPNHWVLLDLQSDAAWYWTYLYNMKVAVTGFLPSSALGHFWSLCVEEQFYLVWPVVVLYLSRKGLLVACATAIVAALLCRVALSNTGSIVLPDVWTPARMDALAVGAFIAVMARVPGGLAGMRRWAIPTAVVTAVPLAFALRYNIALLTFAHTLVALLFGAILVLCLTASPLTALGKTTGSSFLRFFGRYSYALYVFHHPLLWFKPAFNLAVVPTVLGSQLPAYVLWLAISIGACVAIALLSWHLIEKPALNLKRFFPYRAAIVTPSVDAMALAPLPHASSLRARLDG